MTSNSEQLAALCETDSIQKIVKEALTCTHALSITDFIYLNHLSMNIHEMYGPLNAALEANIDQSVVKMESVSMGDILLTVISATDNYYGDFKIFKNQDAIHFDWRKTMFEEKLDNYAANFMNGYKTASFVHDNKVFLAELVKCFVDDNPKLIYANFDFDDAVKTLMDLSGDYYPLDFEAKTVDL